MLVREIMNQNFAVCTEDESLERVFEIMTEKNADCVVVVESRAHFIPIGTITEHDICLQIVGNGRNPRGMKAASVLNKKILKTGDKTSLEKCREMLTSKMAERIFVTDKNGMLCGTLTRAEVEKSLEVKPLPEKMVSKTTVQIYNAPGINRIF